MTVKVTGGDRLAATTASAGRALENLPASVHAEAAQVIRDAARRAAPHRTGFLSRSIVAVPARGGAKVSATARYARPVHYGSKRNRPANPFMDRGLDAGADRAVDVYAEAVDRIVGSIKGA